MAQVVSPGMPASTVTPSADVIPGTDGTPDALTPAQAPEPAYLDTLSAMPTPPAVTPAVVPGDVPAPVPGQNIQITKQQLPSPQELADQQRVRDAEQGLGEAQGAVVPLREADRKEREDQAVDAQGQALLDQDEVNAKVEAHEEERTRLRALREDAEKDIPTSFHDFWANKSTGDRIIAGIARALGTFNPSGHNEAMEYQQKEVDRDFDKQKANILSKENIAKWRRENEDNADARWHEERGDLAWKQSAANKYLAAKNLTMLMKTGMPLEDAEKNVLVKGALLKSAKDDALRDRYWSMGVEKRSGDLGKKTKTAGTGGAGASGAYDKFKAAVLGGEKDLGALAAAAHIKNDKIADQVTKIREEADKEKKLSAQAGDALTKPVNDFVYKRLDEDKTLAADLKESQEVKKALALSKPGPDGNVNGVNMQQAIDATVKAATGLGARPGSIQVFQSSLGGLWDRVMRNIQHGLTGQYTPEDVQTLQTALKKQQAYIRGNLSESEEGHRQEFSGNPMTKGHEEVFEPALIARYGGVPLKNKKTGETKIVSHAEAKKLGAL